jgi:hypothetical protein
VLLTDNKSAAAKRGGLTPATEFSCSDFTPVQCISASWVGAGAIRIAGTAGVTEFDKDGIQPGDLVTQCGYDGSQEHAVWTIYDAGTDNKLGESVFTLSCADASINGPNDCFLPTGDERGTAFCFSDAATVAQCVNAWSFEGVAGNDRVLDCNALANVTVAECESSETAPVTHHFTVFVDGEWKNAVARVDRNGAACTPQQ